MVERSNALVAAIVVLPRVPDALTGVANAVNDGDGVEEGEVVVVVEEKDKCCHEKNMQNNGAVTDLIMRFKADRGDSPHFRCPL
jgi:hypothetical protein